MLSGLEELLDSFKPLGMGKSAIFEDVKELFLLSSFTITIKYYTYYKSIDSDAKT